MNRKAVFLLWAVIAWIAPAAIAGALGWKGVWGTGSAFTDYLIPIPVAGGALHVPSFAAVSLILFTQPWGEKSGGLVRALLFAGALAGVVTLLDLDKLQLAATTDMKGGRFWQQQPVGLFLLTDCLTAQLFAGSLGGRWPRGAKEWSVAVVAALSIPAAYAALALKSDPRQQNPFIYTGSRAGDSRGDESVFYFSKLPPGSEAFRQAAREVIEQHDPRMNVNSEDIAIHFHDSLASAQAQDKASSRYTVCLYQDGTPVTWNAGSFDCFGGHESFSERREKMFGAQDKSLPQDVRLWLARRDACAGRKPLAAPGRHMDNQEVRSCDAASMQAAREELVKKFGGEAAVLQVLQ